MNFGQLLTNTYRILQDPGQAVYANSVIALYASQALRTVGNALSITSGRDASLALVDGQQEYVVPDGVRRITHIRILPEAGTEPGNYLDEYRLGQFPFIDPNNADPQYFAILGGGGTDEDQLKLFLYPSPNRSASNSIIIDYELDYEFLSDDPATTDQKTLQLIPFPKIYHLAVLYFTVYYALSEQDDGHDLEKALYYKNLGMDILRDYSAINSISFYKDNFRAFP